MIETGAALSTRVVRWVDRVLRCALPGRCAFCLGATEQGEPWCEPCLLALPWNWPACPSCAEPLPATLGEGGRPCGACLREPPAFARARVPLRYEGRVAALIQRFKFSGSPRAGTLLLTLLEESLMTLPAADRPQALIAVPLHPSRARERGFDQADWLARRLAGRLGLERIVARRRRETPTQRGLSRRERRANLRRAFVVEAWLPARVAILDDVMTTGATLAALAEACRVAGAEEVEAWAIARTPRR